MAPSLSSVTLATSENSLTGDTPILEGDRLLERITVPKVTDDICRSRVVVLTLLLSGQEGALREWSGIKREMIWRK